MKELIFPLIDITEEGFKRDDCFPVLYKNKILVSKRSFNKHFLNSYYYDANGDCYKVIGYDKISGRSLLDIINSAVKMKLIFELTNESISFKKDWESNSQIKYTFLNQKK